jgi:transcription elongation factor Elf1
MGSPSSGTCRVVRRVKPEARSEPEALAEPPPPRCPFCNSPDAQVISLFGTQVMTMQVKCRSCGTIYEATKY